MSLSTAPRKMSVSSASDSDNPPTPANEPSDSDSGPSRASGRSQKVADNLRDEDRDKTPKADEVNDVNDVNDAAALPPERRTSTPTTLPRFPHSVENLHALAEQLADKQENAEQPVIPTPPPENGSPGKSEAESTVFNQVSYLGCSSIENPSSEKEMLKIVSLMNAEKEHDAIPVILSVPSSSFGTVRLFDAGTQAEMATFPVHRIRFCARGQPDVPERDCFALSFTQQNASTNEGAVHQCHVFRCLVPEAAGKALLCFAAAFRNTPLSDVRRSLPGPKSNASSPSIELTGTEEDYQFEAFLEMKEEDTSKKGYTLCPQEKNCFKLRRGREKRVVMHLQQISGPRTLAVQKCFGLLLAAGRNLRQSDMHLLDMQSMGRGNDNRVYIIEALWDPNTHNFEVLNTETPRETRVFMTVAADVILAGIDEPVRFNVECKARIFHQHERFWYVTRKAIVERYFLTTRKVQDPGNSNAREVVRFESVTERERSMARLSLGRSPSKMVTQLIHPADDDESDSDEPLLSGSGDVCRDCPEDILTEWANCLLAWKGEANRQRPKELNILIRNGIPDVLRGEVWQLLAGVQNDPEMMDTYRCLLGKECPSEQVILRDIHRTFPAHEFFKEAGGVGQDSLYKISKAYSLYDEEVGYCQGLSFLGAALLLHMPEEQAFCVLVKIMFDYGLRDLFKLGFDALHLRFYQLQRLINDYIPDLAAHFVDLGIETHMFASQWFLTLFTAKFPLQMVYFIVDLFLSEGINTIFHISLALLRASKKELLQLDFEGVLKYFRVALPRKYRTESNAKELIHQAVKLRLSHKRLSKYEKDYIVYKKTIETTQDPLERANQEVQTLKETVMRLERENDDLAHELVTSKIELRKNLDAAEDNVESLQTQLERATRTAKDLEEENRNLHAEYEQVKEMCRRELKKLEEESTRGQSIIANYKQICSDLSHRLEKQQTQHAEENKIIRRRIQACEQCCTLFNDDGSVCNSDGSKAQSPVGNGDSLDARLEEREEHIRQIELELAQTKLALVESQCRNQDLTHHISAVTSETEAARNTWLKKTLSSIKEVSSTLKQQGQAVAAVANHERKGSGPSA